MHLAADPQAVRPDCVYVVVRRDLSPRMQLVQAVHAGMEAAYLWPTRAPWLVVLAADNISDLQRIAGELCEAGVRLEMFFEPDDDLGVTAFATEPIAPDRRRMFRRYRLWSE
jgi:hypothetical protein